MCDKKRGCLVRYFISGTRGSYDIVKINKRGNAVFAEFSSTTGGTADRVQNRRRIRIASNMFVIRIRTYNFQLFGYWERERGFLNMYFLKFALNLLSP